MDEKSPNQQVNPQISEDIKSTFQRTKYFLIFTVFLLFVAFIVGGFLLGSRENNQKKACTQEAKQCANGTWVGRTGPNCEFTACPSVTPTPPFKTYKNEKYGFEFNYPIKGIAQNGENFSEIECGNAIKEIGTSISVDNLFKIQILDFSGSLDDYLIQRGAKKTYEFEPITNSNADEAVKVLGIKKGLELVSVGYPPLMYILDIYKKGDKIFLLSHETHPPNRANPEGCINPKDLDDTKFPKYANEDWDIKDSFKFTTPVESCTDLKTKATMTYGNAKTIASSLCKGELKDVHVCNQNTGTWWIDLDPVQKKEGCNPACVINVNTKQAEINWRCTGLDN